ncbi:MAG: MFS transporter [Thermoplasmata archaeon]|nr:MFS transporter [Thermoplasmata archaeon]
MSVPDPGFSNGKPAGGFDPFRGSANRATVALIGLRIAYAYNWFDIGPALPSIGSEFGVSSAGWGLLIASFLIGAGLLQVPAGFLAGKFGTRSVSMAGAGLLGISALGSALAPNFVTLLVARALGGAGAGLFFSPAIGLVSSLHPEGKRGIPVGVFSSAFSAGAGLGVFASALIVPMFGWRIALVVGGVLVLVSLGVGELLVPRSAGPPLVGTGRSRRGIPAALRSPAVWAIGLAFIGLEGASLSAGQFFVPYAQMVKGWAPALAGGVGALFVFPSVFGGPTGGHLAERYTNRRTQMVVFTAVPALLLGLIPWVGLPGVALIAVFFSFSYGMVYAMMYILPPYLPGLAANDTPLAIGLLNALQLLGGSSVAYAVGWVVATRGYTPAWELLGLVSVATLVFLALVPVTGRLSTRVMEPIQGSRSGGVSQK